ncbi:hypothetical protein [Winogradskyella sp.]
MKHILYCILFLLLLNCKKTSKIEVVERMIETQEAVSEDSLKLDLNFKPKGNYAELRRKIINDKAYFKRRYQTDRTKAIDSASNYIYATLLNGIVPHWYGTTWDFNGHTDIPNNGEIACGYFVSTTLKHLGFNLNRYKMAQAAGLNEAKLLQQKSSLKIFSGLSFDELKSRVNKVYGDGLYFVGLDNHVGYVLILNKELYFLHSSYCDDKVVIELAEDSYCFSSNLYVFAEITTNRSLVESWILNTRLGIPNT